LLYKYVHTTPLYSRFKNSHLVTKNIKNNDIYADESPPDKHWKVEPAHYGMYAAINGSNGENQWVEVLTEKSGI